MIIMENVVSGSAHELAAHVLAPEMALKTIHASTQDVGYGSCRRLRGWLIAVRREEGAFLMDPQDAYEAITTDLWKKQVPIPALFWSEDEPELSLGYHSVDNLVLL